MRFAVVLAAMLALAGGQFAVAQTPPPSFSEGLPYRNGPFAAFMVFVPAADLSEFAKPSDQAPRVTPQTEAHVGDVMAVKLIFSGAERDAQGAVDVSYDLRLLRPDGKIYSGVDERGLEGARVVVPADVGLLDNRTKVVAMRFEAQDPAGVYTAEAMLHDNIGKRDIPLAARIELVK